MKVVVEYRGGSIELPEGESVLGAGRLVSHPFQRSVGLSPTCPLSVSFGKVYLEDLKSTNGCKINGEPVAGKRSLKDHDLVELGNVWFRLRIHQDVDEEAEDTLSEDTFSGKASGVAEGKERGSRPTPARLLPQLHDVSVPEFATLNCPRCRSAAPVNSDRCESCGYEWPKGRPTSNTERIDLRALRLAGPPPGGERRTSVRVPIEIPVIYDSVTLTFDATARDLSEGGMFVATELLDDIGTSCRLTVLPDGGPAIAIEGTVSHVVTADAGEAGAPPGMGIEFTKLGTEAVRWLQLALSGVAVAQRG